MTTGQKHLPYPKRGVPALRDGNSPWPCDQFRIDVEKWLYQAELRCLGFYKVIEQEKNMRLEWKRWIILLMEEDV